jgi:sortase A
LSFTIVSDAYFSKIVTPVADSQPVAFAADYGNANIWYPTSPQKHVMAPVNTYTLSIPKLKIENALVTIAGDDLHASLVHYGGTGLPGQYGNAVVFGHSTLPQFYSPTNYTSIFSLLPTLKVGDDILVTYDGVTYRYTIFEMLVLDPTDLSVLEQRFDDSYLTLVTCVPPGTYWKRLNIRAKLRSL